jgi:hypothetical protein
MNHEPSTLIIGLLALACGYLATVSLACLVLVLYDDSAAAHRIASLRPTADAPRRYPRNPFRLVQRGARR